MYYSSYNCSGGIVLNSEWVFFVLLRLLKLLPNYVLYIWLYMWRQTLVETDEETKLKELAAKEDPGLTQE